METDNFQNDKISSLNTSKDQYTDLSDLKKRTLLKYENRDLYLLNLKEDVLPGKTLFFPYCNEISDSLKKLDFQSIIICNSQFKLYSCEILDNNKKKIISVDFDPIMVVMMLLELNVKIDCIIGIKDEIYTDNYSFMLDMCIPILKDKLVYVSSKMNRVGPFKLINSNIQKLSFRTKINISSDYFTFFTDDALKEIYSTFGESYDVVLLEKPSNKCKVSLINGKRVNVINDSIWRYTPMLHLSFIEFDNTFQQAIISQTYDNIFNVRGKYQTEDEMMLDLNEEFDIQVICNMCKAKTIGFTYNWRNKEQIKLLLEPNNGLRDIYIFCPDHDQYMELYYIHWEDVIDDDL